MHSAIIFAVMPESAYEARQKAALLLVDIDKLERGGEVSRLGEFVWEICFQKFPHAFATLVRTLEQLAIPYGMLQLDAAPQWIQRDPKENRTSWRNGSLVES
jgi:hypothetical protein